MSKIFSIELISIQRYEWFKTLIDTRTHFTIKNECEKEKKTFFITLDQLDNILKRIIALAQIFGGTKSHFFYANN